MGEPGQTEVEAGPQVETPEPALDGGVPAKTRAEIEAEVEADLELAFMDAPPPGPIDQKNDEALRNLFDQGEIDTLECRASRCRLELSFENASTAEERLQEAFLADGSSLNLAGTITSRREERDGSAIVRVHLYDDTKDVPQEPGHE